MVNTLPVAVRELPIITRTHSSSVTSHSRRCYYQDMGCCFWRVEAYLARPSRGDLNDRLEPRFQNSSVWFGRQVN